MGEASTIPTGSLLEEVCLVACVLSLFVLTRLLWPHFKFEYPPLHSAMEGVGGFMAMVIAAILIHVDREAGTGGLPWIALGLLSMGLLDAFHAMASPGNGFVLLHSAAGLVGSFLAALIWLPQSARFTYLTRNWILKGLIAGSIGFGLWALLFRETLPAMVQHGTFTSAAITINVTSGVLFFAAAARLLLEFQNCSKQGHCVFVGMATLFGFAHLMFPFSALWDATWWLWHLLRLTAYIWVLQWVVRGYQRTFSNLKAALVERNHAEAVKHEAERLYRTLFEQSPDGVLLIDPETALPIMFNATAHRHLTSIT
ncbi:MAG: hypothetical protein HY645_13225 [Acidobacteria bacterium]|nr:hypothetical protein [Acidobacteriota bacterium]